MKPAMPTCSKVACGAAVAYHCKPSHSEALLCCQVTPFVQSTVWLLHLPLVLIVHAQSWRNIQAPGLKFQHRHKYDSYTSNMCP